MLDKLTEGGNVFDGTVDIKKEYAQDLIQTVKNLLPGFKMHFDIGSVGYKIASGDMDVFLDQDEVVSRFKAPDEKVAKQSLSQYIQARGFETAIKGRNVHVKVPLPDSNFAQVDLMVIPDASAVAPWHQHGPRGSYQDPSFKGSQIFILMNSIGKALGLKFDAFGGKLLRRDNNEVIARTRDEVAKILLNPKASGADLDSVKTIMRALENDPNKDAKLAQARDDAAKGLLTLPEGISPGSEQWYKKIYEMFK